MEPETDAVDDVGRGYGEVVADDDRAEEVHDAVIRDSDGEGRSSTPNVDIARRRSTFQEPWSMFSTACLCRRTERVQSIWV